MFTQASEKAHLHGHPERNIRTIYRSLSPHVFVLPLFRGQSGLLSSLNFELIAGMPQEYHKNPSSIGGRAYTPFAQWKFREFNELPHLFTRRLDESYPTANIYIAQFPNEKVAIVMRFVISPRRFFPSISISSAHRKSQFYHYCCEHQIRRVHSGFLRCGPCPRFDPRPRHFPPF